jgi:protein-tyrosine phosphatase
MAASVATALIADAGLSDEVVVESFGTAGYHEGERADAQAEAALTRRGWPAGGHRARRLRPSDVAAADLVLCADKANVVEVRRVSAMGPDASKVALLRSYDPDVTPADDEVPDPWGGDDADFDRSLVLIERACRGLVGHLASTRR